MALNRRLIWIPPSRRRSPGFDYSCIPSQRPPLFVPHKPGPGGDGPVTSTSGSRSPDDAQNGCIPSQRPPLFDPHKPGPGGDAPVASTRESRPPRRANHPRHARTGGIPSQQPPLFVPHKPGPGGDGPVTSTGGSRTSNDAQPGWMPSQRPPLFDPHKPGPGGDAPVASTRESRPTRRANHPRHARTGCMPSQQPPLFDPHKPGPGGDGPVTSTSGSRPPRRANHPRHARTGSITSQQPPLCVPHKPGPGGDGPVTSTSGSRPSNDAQPENNQLQDREEMTSEILQDEDETTDKENHVIAWTCDGGLNDPAAQYSGFKNQLGYEQLMEERTNIKRLSSCWNIHLIDRDECAKEYFANKEKKRKKLENQIKRKNKPKVERKRKKRGRKHLTSRKSTHANKQIRKWRQSLNGTRKSDNKENEPIVKRKRGRPTKSGREPLKLPTRKSGRLLSVIKYL